MVVSDIDDKGRLKLFGGIKARRGFALKIIYHNPLYPKSRNSMRFSFKIRRFFT